MLFPWVDEQRPYWTNHTNMPERFRTALGPGVVSLRCNVARGYRSRSRPFESHLLGMPTRRSLKVAKTCRNRERRQMMVATDPISPLASGAAATCCSSDMLVHRRGM